LKETEAVKARYAGGKASDRGRKGLTAKDH